jgi:hypothetical protein
MAALVPLHALSLFKAVMAVIKGDMITMREIISGEDFRCVRVRVRVCPHVLCVYVYCARYIHIYTCIHPCIHPLHTSNRQEVANSLKVDPEIFVSILSMVTGTRVKPEDVEKFGRRRVCVC